MTNETETETETEPTYPEHEKLQAVKEQSQTCGELLEWLQSEKGWHLPPYSANRLLAEFFEIDYAELQAEKDRMLDAMRAMNEPS